VVVAAAVNKVAMVSNRAGVAWVMAPKDGTSRLMASKQVMAMVNNKDMTSLGDSKVMDSNNKDMGSSNKHGGASNSKVMVRLQDMDSNRDTDNPNNRAMVSSQDMSSNKLMAHKAMDSSRTKDGNRMLAAAMVMAMDMVHLRRLVATMQDMDNKVVLEAKLKLQQVEEEEDLMVQVEGTIHTSAENTHTSLLQNLLLLRHYFCK